MNVKTLGTTVFLLSSTTALHAGTDLDGVVKILEDQGFDKVEIERDDGRITIEAEGPNVDRTLVYDVETGELLVDEVEYDSDDDDDDELDDEEFDEDDDDESDESDDEEDDEDDESDESDESDDDDDEDEDSDDDDDSDDGEDGGDESDDDDDDD